MLLAIRTNRRYGPDKSNQEFSLPISRIYRIVSPSLSPLGYTYLEFVKACKSSLHGKRGESFSEGADPRRGMPSLVTRAGFQAKDSA